MHNKQYKFRQCTLNLSALSHNICFNRITVILSKKELLWYLIRYEIWLNHLMWLWCKEDNISHSICDIVPGVCKSSNNNKMVNPNSVLNQIMKESLKLDSLREYMII